MSQRLICYLVALITVGLVAACGSAPVALPAPAPTSAPTAQAAAPVAQRKPTFIEFYADWCGTCQSMKPIVTRLEEMYKDKVMFELINIDLPESADAKQKYRFIGQPQFVIVKPNGEVLVSRNGYQQLERLRDDLNQALGVDQ